MTDLNTPPETRHAKDCLDGTLPCGSPETHCPPGREPGTERATASGSVPVDLIEDGLLWLINASVFHPRGFALAIAPSTGELTLMGDGTEAWSYLSKEVNPEHGVDLDAKLAAVRDLFERAARQNSTKTCH
jgi:hypothetical protein